MSLITHYTRGATNMDNAAVLASAMAEKCREYIRNWEKTEHLLPKALKAVHLDWMCGQILNHVEDWPPTKLHRWIGFIQSGMLANRMTDLEGLKETFAKVKIAFGETCEDLADHLDTCSSFELDIGGSG
jgi:hypothetical protein